MKTDGGPAFPMASYTDCEGSHVWGLSKREYFAGLAMQSIVSTIKKDASCEAIAREAVKLADAMVAALNAAREGRCS